MIKSVNLSKIYLLSNNSNYEYSDLHLSSKLLFRVMYISLSISNFFGNSLIMFVIINNKKMHKVTNFFVLNLASADILTSLFSIPFQVFYHINFYVLVFESKFFHNYLSLNSMILKTQCGRQFFVN